MSRLEDLLRSPPSSGPPEGTNAVGRVGNPACGDLVTMSLHLEGGRVIAAGYECLGSPYQKAVAQVVAELAPGLDVSAAGRLTKADVVAVLPDLPERHYHLAQLATDALRRALEHADDRLLRATGPTGAGDDALLEVLSTDPMTTGQVATACQSRGIRCGSPLRSLSRMRSEGKLAGAAGSDGTWKWWRSG